jgi:hypothetical protein
MILQKPLALAAGLPGGLQSIDQEGKHEDHRNDDHSSHDEAFSIRVLLPKGLVFGSRQLTCSWDEKPTTCSLRVISRAA